MISISILYEKKHSQKLQISQKLKQTKTLYHKTRSQTNQKHYQSEIQKLKIYGS